MNTENIKEMAVKAKDKVTEFVAEHEDDISTFMGMCACAFMAYIAGYGNATGKMLYNEQRIRYAAAAATPHVEVHTDIPKEVK